MKKLFYIIMAFYGVFVAPQSHAQIADEQFRELLLTGQKPTEAEWQYVLVKPNEPPQYLYITPPQFGDETSFDTAILAQKTLNFDISALQWIGIIPADKFNPNIGGYAIIGQRDGQYLTLKSFKEIIENEDENASEALNNESGEAAPEVNLSDEIQPLQTLSESPRFDRQNNPTTLVSVKRNELWFKHPSILVEQLDHLAAGGVVINIPISEMGDYPIQPIELKRFISTAQDHNITVWSQITLSFDDPVATLEAGRKTIQALKNYNANVAENERIRGVQISMNWGEVAGYYFYKKNWLNKAIDLYASLIVSADTLETDLILPQDIVSFTDDETIFGRLAVIADGLSIIVEDETQDKVLETLKPLEIWAQKNRKIYKIALQGQWHKKSIDGNLISDDTGNIRAIKMGDWVVLMNVETGLLNIGQGYRLEQNMSTISSKKQYVTDFLSLSDDIDIWFFSRSGYAGQILFGLPNFTP